MCSSEWSNNSVRGKRKLLSLRSTNNTDNTNIITQSQGRTVFLMMLGTVGSAHLFEMYLCTPLTNLPPKISWGYVLNHRPIFCRTQTDFQHPFPSSFFLIQIFRKISQRTHVCKPTRQTKPQKHLEKSVIQNQATKKKDKPLGSVTLSAVKDIRTKTANSRADIKSPSLQ